MDKSKFWLLMLLIVQRKNLAVTFWYLWFWCPRDATSRAWWIGQGTKIHHSSAATLRINLGVLIFPSVLMRKTLWSSQSNQRDFKSSSLCTWLLTFLQFMTAEESRDELWSKWVELLSTFCNLLHSCDQNYDKISYEV